MSKGKRRPLCLALFACIAAAGIVAFLLLSRSAINRENFEKIAVGMTLAEVETILGGPQRDESTGPVVPDHDDTMLLALGTSGGVQEKHWTSNSVAVRVDLNAEGR